MSDQLMDVRTLLARSEGVRVERGRDGIVHVLIGPVTLHLSRGVCEELATTLARAVLALAKSQRERPALELLLGGAATFDVATPKTEPLR